MPCSVVTIRVSADVIGIHGYEMNYLVLSYLGSRPYHAIQNGVRKLSNLDNVYIPHVIVGYTQTIDLMCKSANLVHVTHGDRMKL